MVNPYQVMTARKATPADYVANRAMWTSLLETENLGYRLYTGRKPDLLLGLVPVKGVQNFEITRSQDVLKFRSVKGIYMAHQRGNVLGMRLDIRLFGSDIDKGVYLTLFQFLHAFGDLAELSKQVPVNKIGIVSPTSAALLSAVDAVDYVDTSGNTVRITGDTVIIKDVYHRTFAIWSDDEIFFDMYIESVHYNKDVKTGDAIDVILFLRQYHPIPVPESVDVTEETVVVKKKQMGRDSSKDDDEVTITNLVVKLNRDPKEFKNVAVGDLGINFARNGVKMISSLLNSPSWVHNTPIERLFNATTYKKEPTPPKSFSMCAYSGVTIQDKSTLKESNDLSDIAAALTSEYIGVPKVINGDNGTSIYATEQLVFLPIITNLQGKYKSSENVSIELDKKILIRWDDESFTFPLNKGFYVITLSLRKKYTLLFSINTSINVYSIVQRSGTNA